MVVSPMSSIDNNRRNQFSMMMSRKGLCSRSYIDNDERYNEDPICENVIRLLPYTHHKANLSSSLLSSCQSTIPSHVCNSKFEISNLEANDNHHHVIHWNELSDDDDDNDHSTVPTTADHPISQSTWDDENTILGSILSEEPHSELVKEYCRSSWWEHIDDPSRPALGQQEVVSHEPPRAPRRASTHSELLKEYCINLLGKVSFLDQPEFSLMNECEIPATLLSSTFSPRKERELMGNETTTSSKFYTNFVQPKLRSSITHTLSTSNVPEDSMDGSTNSSSNYNSTNHTKDSKILKVHNSTHTKRHDFLLLSSVQVPKNIRWEEESMLHASHVPPNQPFRESTGICLMDDDQDNDDQWNISRLSDCVSMYVS